MTPWTVARQAPLSMGFPRQEYWNGLQCPSPGNLPNPGTEPVSLASPALEGEFSTTESPGKGVHAQELSDFFSCTGTWAFCKQRDTSLLPFPHCWHGCVLSRFSCVWLCDPMDCSPPGSSVCGILQARILEWVAMPFSRGSSQPRDQTWVSGVSCVGRRGSLPLAPPGKPWCGYPVLLLAQRMG